MGARHRTGEGRTLSARLRRASFPPGLGQRTTVSHPVVLTECDMLAVTNGDRQGVAQPVTTHSEVTGSDDDG